MSASRFRGRSAVLLLMLVAAVVVIEGFALSWGGRITTSPAKRPSTTRTTVSILDPVRSGCVPGGRDHLMHVNYVRFAIGFYPATITGNDAKFIPGGPDDGHFMTLATQRTVILSPDVRITLLDDRAEIIYYVGSMVQLNDYLARSAGPNIFCVQGPLSGATAVTAEYHP